MTADFFDGMAAAFDLVARWVRDDTVPAANILEQYADVQRQTARTIREAGQ